MSRESYTIKDWPEDERPRERLLRQGPQALSNAELLAIFLRTGIPGKTARDLGQMLLERFGGLRGLYAAEDSELSQVKGLGTAKIAQLRAAIELSRRYLEEKLKERKEITDPDQVRELLLCSLRDSKQEEFQLLLLTARRCLIEMVSLSRGSSNQAQPYAQEIIRLALRYNAPILILAHNHPSGNPTPSLGDKAFTRELTIACEASGLSFQDHVIIGNNRLFSFAMDGLLAKYREVVRQLRQDRSDL